MVLTTIEIKSMSKIIIMSHVYIDRLFFQQEVMLQNANIISGICPSMFCSLTIQVC